MNRQQIYIALLLLLGIALGSFWFLENFELREDEIPTGYSGEASHNPLFAARLFLRRMGIDARKITMPELNKKTLTDTDTLLITTGRGTINETKTKRLLQWVQEGGYLVVRSVEPEYFDSEEEEAPAPPDDPLLEMLGLQPQYASEAQWDDELNPLDIPSRDGERKQLHVDFQYNYRLLGADADEYVITGFNGDHMVFRPHGKGFIAVASDLDFVSNWQIHQHDHAEALWEIIHWAHNDGGVVWLLHDEDMPSLWTLLWGRSQPLMVTLTLMLLLALSMGLFRFGPLLSQPPAARRSLLEHIEASGRFFWQHRQQRLIEQVREALLKRLAQHHPGWQELNQQERLEMLSEYSGMTTEAMDALLHQPGPFQPQDFTRLIRQLEQLRKQL